MRSYFAKHSWGNTELRDFLTELEATSGRDLSAWSALWLEKAGVTLLRPEIAVDDAGIITSFAVLQEVPDEYPVQRPHRLAVGGYDLDATTGRLVRTVHVELDVDGARTEVPALVGVPRPALVLVNDDDLAYAKIRLDPQSLATAIEHLGKFDDSLPRTLVWTAAWDATRDGETPARDFVDLVLGNLAHETDSSVLLVLLRQLSTTLDLFVAPEHRPASDAAAADALLALARAAQAGSDTQLQLVKAFAGRAATSDQLDAVRDLLDGHATLDGLSIDTDLRWELLASLVAGGRAGEPDIAAQLAADATATGQRAAAAARAAVPTAEAKATAWSAVTDGDGLPNAIQAATIAGFGRVHDIGLLLPWVAPYFEGLEQIWESKTSEMAQNIVVGLYPTDLAGDTRVDVLQLTDEWLAGHPDAAPALRRLVLESRDGVRRALAAQEADRTLTGQGPRAGSESAATDGGSEPRTEGGAPPSVGGPSLRRRGGVERSGVEDGCQRAQARVGEQVVDQHDATGSVGQGHLPVRVLLVRAGLVLRATLPHGVGQRDADEDGRRGQHVHVQGLDDLPLRRVVAEEPALAEHPEHLVALRDRGRAHHLDRLGQQAQPFADRDVLTVEVARGGRQVVGRHRGQHERPVVLGGERCAVHVPLEPEHGRPEDPAVGQVVPHPRLDDAEVLADHDRARAVRLERQDPDERLVVVPDVRAVARVGTLGDPPEPEQPDHVVDPDGAGVPQHRPQHVPVRLVGGSGQRVRAPRRLGPVLPLLVVHVGRCADGRAAARARRRAPTRRHPRGARPPRGRA